MKHTNLKSIALFIALSTFFAYYQIGLTGKDITGINIFFLICIGILADPLNRLPYKWEKKHIKKCCAYWVTMLIILANWFVEPLFYDYFDPVYVGLAFLVVDILYSFFLVLFMERYGQDEKDDLKPNI